MVNIQKTLYIPTDRETINRCKNIDIHEICKRNQPLIEISGTQTCDNQIIRSSVKSLDYNFRQMSPSKINELVYIQLNDEKAYLLIPEKDLEINILCDKNAQHLTLPKAIFLESDENCILQTDSLIIKLRKTSEIRRITYYNK